MVGKMVLKGHVQFMRWISMFDLPGNELFDGFIDFSNQLVYQLTYLYLLAPVPLRSCFVYAWAHHGYSSFGHKIST